MVLGMGQNNTAVDIFMAFLLHCQKKKNNQRTNELNKYCYVRSLFFPNADTFQFAHNSRLKSFNWNIGSFEVKKAMLKQSKMSIIWNFTKKIVLFLCVCWFYVWIFPPREFLHLITTQRKETETLWIRREKHRVDYSMAFNRHYPEKLLAYQHQIEHFPQNSWEIQSIKHLLRSNI